MIANVCSYLIGKLPDESANCIKFADGMMIQYGRIENPAAGSGSVIIDLPESFIHKSYVITATPEYASSAYPVFAVSVQRLNAGQAAIYFRQIYTNAVITGVRASYFSPCFNNLL